MMDGMNNMMGPLMGVMIGYWVLLSLLVLVILGLVAVWLFQQIRREPAGPAAPSARAYPPDPPVSA